MQPVEEFLNEYFRMRAKYSRLSSPKRVDAYLDRFTALGYGTSHWIMEQGDTETIVSVQSSESGAEAITSAYTKKHDQTHRARYQLVPMGESWQIASIEIECFLCDGTGKLNLSECELCKGKGWRAD
jgi:hypothetical protein